jgi:NADH:ubiquinone oxidoreductase subunit H
MFSLFIVFTIATLISTGRVPFDLAEAESELISGVSTELGGISFSLLLIFDYVELLFLLSIVIQSIVIYDQVVVFVVLAILVCYIGRIVLCRYLLVDIIKLVYVILF